MYIILQGKVRQNYNKLIDSYWKIINTDSKTQDEVFEEIKGLAEDIISKEKSNDTETLWPMSESIDQMGLVISEELHLKLPNLR